MLARCEHAPSARRAPARSARAPAARRCRGRAGARRRGARGPRRPPRAPRAPARACPARARAPGARRRRPACRPRAGARPRRRPRSRVGRRLGRRRRRAPPATTIRSPAATRVALGPLGAVDAHAPGVDQPLRRGARAGVGGEEDVEPLAGRRGVDGQLSGGHRARRSLEHVQQPSTPNVIAMSATLNAGHGPRSMKSVTAPSRDAVDQVAERAAEQQADRQPDQRARPVWVRKKTSSAISAASASTARSAPPPSNRPNATPLLRTLTSPMPGNSSTSVPRSIAPRTIALTPGRRDEPRRRPAAAVERARPHATDEPDDDRRRRSGARGWRRSG